MTTGFGGERKPLYAKLKVTHKGTPALYEELEEGAPELGAEMRRLAALGAAARRLGISFVGDERSNHLVLRTGAVFVDLNALASGEGVRVASPSMTDVAPLPVSSSKAAAKDGAEAEKSSPGNTGRVSASSGAKVAEGGSGSQKTRREDGIADRARSPGNTSAASAVGQGGGVAPRPMEEDEVNEGLAAVEASLF